MLIVAIGTTAGADEDVTRVSHEETIIGNVLHDMAKRFNRVESAHYVVATTVTRRMETLNNLGDLTGGLVIPRRVPPNDSRWNAQTTLEFDFKTSRMRKELVSYSFHTLENCYLPYRNVYLFTGTQVLTINDKAARVVTEKRHRLIQGSTSLVTANDATMATFRTLDDHPLYFAHGLLLLGNPRFEPPLQTLDPSAFRVVRNVHCEGGNPSTLVAIELTNLRGSAREVTRYTCDSAQESAVVAVERHINDMKSFQLSIQHKRDETGWYPTKWRSDEYDAAGNAVQSAISEISEWSHAPIDASNFTLSLKPGTSVATEDGTCVVDSDGQTLTPVIESQSTLSPRSFWGPTVSTIAVIAVLWMMRRRTQTVMGQRSG